MSQLIAVGGGKGGVGKSFFSSNLSYLMGQEGQRILLVDMDLGSGNIHSYLGIKDNTHSLSDFVKQRVSNIQQAIVKTPYSGLSIISGAQEDLDIQNMSEHLVQNLLVQLKSLNYDYVVLDLGAGNHNIFVDVFNQADSSILVSSPERTSLENALRFVKTAFFRRFHLAEKKGLGIGPALRQIRQESDRPSGSFKEILNLAGTHNSFMKTQIDRELSDFQLKVVLNLVQDRTEVGYGLNLAKTCHSEFGVNTNFLGFLPFSMGCRSAIVRQIPLTSEDEQEEVRQNFHQIIQNLQSHLLSDDEKEENVKSA